MALSSKPLVEGMASISIDPTTDSRPRRIFNHFDVDGDGLLKFDELNALQTVTSGVGLSKKQWKAVCGTFGINPNKSGLSLAHIGMTYQTESANVEEDFRKVFPDEIPFAPHKHLMVRNEMFISKPMIFSSPNIDISKINAASFINEHANDTNYFIPDKTFDQFNKKWRTALRISFASNGNESQLNDWLKNGVSNNNKLQLQLMALPPNHTFKVHGHPNIEFILSLVGAIHEIKLIENLPIETFESSSSSLSSSSSSLSASADASNPSIENVVHCVGPNLNKINENKSEKLSFKKSALSANRFMSNAIGSIHQSYTESDGALLLVLWSGCHANIKPENCDKLGECEGASLLKPGAGWA